MRIALIGCGSIGRIVHLKNLKKNKKVDVVTLVDTSKKRLAEANILIPKAETYTSSEELFKKGKFEAVIISTPHDSHGELAKSALSAGAVVYLEKPLCIDITEGKCMC